jgi:hypothetical protein
MDDRKFQNLMFDKKYCVFFAASCNKKTEIKLKRDISKAETDASMYSVQDRYRGW